MGRRKAEDDPLLADFSRHIVGLSIHHHAVDGDGVAGPEEVLQIPGVLVKMHGHHSLLTAGHSLDLIEDIRDSKNHVIDSVVLVDHFGPHAKDELTVPFDLHHAVQLSVYDEDAGIDFGLVRLSDYYVKLLDAQKVMPLALSNFAHVDEQFWQYFLIGLPTERVSIEGAEQVHVTMDLILIPVFETTTPKGSEKPYPRFTAEIREMGDLQDIDGMSGGPVFGVMRGDPCEYRLVAVQSGWLPRSKVIFATPVDVITALIDQALQGAELHEGA